MYRASAVGRLERRQETDGLGEKSTGVRLDGLLVGGVDGTAGALNMDDQWVALPTKGHRELVANIRKAETYAP